MGLEEQIVILIAIIALFLTTIFGLLAFYCVNEHSKRKYFVNKTFTIDYTNKVVKFFNKKYLDGVSSVSLNSFYRLFDFETGKNLMSLVEQICENVEDAQHVLDVDALLKFNTDTYYRALIDVTSYNAEKQILHCNLYYFHNLPLLYGNDNKKQKRINKIFNSTSYDIQNEFNASQFFEGASYMFTITVLMHINSLNYNNYIYGEFYNILAKFVKQGKVIVRYDVNKFVVHDFKVTTRSNSYRFIKLINNEFSKFLALNSLTQYVRVNIGIVEHKFFPRDYLVTMKYLKQVNETAVNQNKPYVCYEASNKGNFSFDESYRNEAESVILKKQFNYKFEPVLDCINLKVIGFFTYIVPDSNVFSDFNELKLYAYKLELGRPLFMEVMKYVTNKASSELYEVFPRDTIIFVSINFLGLDIALKNLRYINKISAIKICLVFSETDISKNLSSEEIINKFTDLSKICDLGLLVSDQSLILPNNLYETFSYFVFDSPEKENARSTSHDSFVLRKSIEKVLRFRKVVVLRNVKTPTDVEVRVQSALRYLSGPAIGPANEMFLPVDKKTIDRISKIEIK
jgi:hypothetical protein